MRPSLAGIAAADGAHHRLGLERGRRRGNTPTFPCRNTLRGAFWAVDATNRAGTDLRYDGYNHFGFKPTRAEAIDGVWELARACMRTYLILRDKGHRVRQRPQVQAALEAAMVSELDTPTLSAGEALVDVRGETADIEALGARSVGLEALDQLAMEHLLGVR